MARCHTLAVACVLAALLASMGSGGVRHMEGPESQGVELNSSINLTCVFRAGYDISDMVQWRRGDENLTDGVSTVAMGNMKYTSTLVVESVTFDDCGSYTCFMGVASSPPAELWVYDLSTSNSNPTSSVGAVDTLSCSIRSCGDFSITWFAYDDEGTESPSITTRNITVNDTLVDITSEYTITTLGLINEGRSQLCTVEFSRVNITHRFFNYTLDNVEVTVDLSSENITNGSVIQGNDVVFTCTATNPPNVSLPLTIAWFRGDYMLVNKPGKLEIVRVNNTLTLTISDIQDTAIDEGLYVCEAYNRDPPDAVRESIIIDVISGPVISFPGVPVNLGESVEVTCDTAGSNPPATNITVTANGTEVQPKMTTPQSVTFTIEGEFLNQTGTVYHCTAVNSIGTTSEDFTLVVRAAPDAVDISTIKNETLSLLVTRITWDHPVSNNANITGYNVTVTDLTGSVVYETDGPSAGVLLTPTMSQTVNITATNVVGSSISDSVDITGVTEGANATITRATALSPDLVILEWSPGNLVRNFATSDSEPSQESDIIIRGFNISTTEDGDPEIQTQDMISLYHVEDEDKDGDEDGSTVALEVEVDYEEPKIYNNLETTTTVSVELPSVGVVPEVNQNPRGDPVPSMNGFTVAWNPPATVENPDFIKHYYVRVEELPEGNGRRKRQAPFSDTTTDTMYQFTSGKPFTMYYVSVNATLDVNRVTGEVVALARTPIRSSEAAASAPLDLETIGDPGVTSVILQWREPNEPNGNILGYTVMVMPANGEGTVREEIPEVTSVTVSGLRGHTMYDATVLARNGAGDGATSTSHRFTTNFGVFPPEISGTITTIQQLYLFTTERFSDEYGPISHYEVYAVIASEIPDTSEVEESTTNAYIAFAGTARAGERASVTIGTGDTGDVGVGSVTISYENRLVQPGELYYFFVRLYSSVDQRTFSDSPPRRPTTIYISASDNCVQAQSTSESGATIGGVVGAVVIIAIVTVVVHVVIALVLRSRRGNYSTSAKNRNETVDVPAATGLDLSKFSDDTYETPFQTTSNEAYNLVAPRNVGRIQEYETPQNLPPSTTSQPTTDAAEDSLYEPV